MDGVELDVRDVENLSDAFSETGLARARVPDDRHPIHGPIIADEL